MIKFTEKLLLPTLCLVACLFTTVNAQNLVVNPSFEITNTNCSGFAGEGFRQDLDPTWDNANSNLPGDSCSSPDLFSACNIAFTNMPGGGLGSLGYQWSRTGTRHVGLIAYSAPFGIGDQYREYIEGHTTTPLVGGQTYCVSMYVSLADGSPWAIEELGVYFSNTHYLRDACAAGSRINVTPHLENTCGVISDTTYKWVRLQWDYVATGGEQYFVIGNFRNDAGTTKVSTGASSLSNMFAYYFIDDVSIVANSCCFADITKVNTQCLSGSAITLTATPGIGAVCTQAVNGTWSGPGITNASTGVFSPSAAGTGVHTISLTLACGFTATTSIAVSPCAVLNVCKEANGSLTASNGVAPYTWSVYVPATSTPITNQAQCQACGYTWVPFVNQCLNGGMPASSCTTAATFSVYATGTTAMPPGGATQVVVTDASGTTLTVTPASVPNCTTTVSCPTLTMAVSSQTNVNCFGASTGTAAISTTGGTGPYTYTWSPGNLSGASQTGLAAGTYTIAIKDANQCPGTGTVIITQPAAALAASITGTVNAGCGVSNGSATVTATGGTTGYTYSWTPNGGSGTSASNLSSGNNTVTVTDSKGCTTTAVAVISSAGGPTLSVASQTNVNCFGASTGTATISQTGGTGPYTYTWTPGNLSGASQSNLAAGVYTINVSDANLCTSSITVSITQPAAALAASITGTTNAGCGVSNGSATVTATGGTAGYTYSWTPNGGSGTSVSNLSSGNNTVTVTDTKGCITTAVAVISTVGGPTLAVASQTNVNCFGASTGTAAISASGGTGPYTYTWSPGNLPGASQNNLAAGIYTINVNDANLCASSITVAITQPTAALSGSISSTTASSCGGNNGGATITTSGGTPSYTYSWSPNGGSGASASNLSSGNNTVVITDSKGCTQNVVVSITSAGGPTVTINSQANVRCFGASTGSATAVANGGNGPYTYTWIPGNLTGATQTALAAGIYTISSTDANLCVGSTTVLITQPTSSLTASIAGTSPGCGLTNGTATVTANGGTPAYTYTWNTNSNNTSLSGLNAGSYSVTVTDANGCTTTATTVLSSAGGASLAIAAQTDATCAGLSDGTATITATSGSGIYTYTWSPMGGNAASATGLAAGTYTVHVSDGTCTNSILVTIGNNFSFAVDAGPTVVITQGGSTVLSATGPIGGNYNWTPSGSLSCSNCSVTTASPDQTTTYTLIVNNVQGCTSIDTVTVIVDIPCGDLFIPSAFSPNEDGSNDVLFVMGSCITNLTFAVFDRWGEKVFETSSQSTGWDGTFQGKKMDPAVFAYYLRATVNGEEVKKNGSITLVK